MYIKLIFRLPSAQDNHGQQGTDIRKRIGDHIRLCPGFSHQHPHGRGTGHTASDYTSGMEIAFFHHYAADRIPPQDGHQRNNSSVKTPCKIEGGMQLDSRGDA